MVSPDAFQDGGAIYLWSIEFLIVSSAGVWRSRCPRGSTAPLQAVLGMKAVLALRKNYGGDQWDACSQCEYGRVDK